MLSGSQRNFAHVTTVTLLWCVQNFIVVRWAYFKPEHGKFCSDFEFDWNIVRGTGTRPTFFTRSHNKESSRQHIILIGKNDINTNTSSTYNNEKTLIEVNTTEINIKLNFFSTSPDSTELKLAACLLQFWVKHWPQIAIFNGAQHIWIHAAQDAMPRLFAIWFTACSGRLNTVPWNDGLMDKNLSAWRNFWEIHKYWRLWMHFSKQLSKEYENELKWWHYKKFKGHLNKIFDKWMIFKLNLVTGGLAISWEIPLRRMLFNLNDDKSKTLVQVMAWCNQATSHYQMSWTNPDLCCHMALLGNYELMNIFQWGKLTLANTNEFWAGRV